MKLAIDYLALANEIKSRVDSVDITLFAATEAHLSKKIADKKGVVLAITIPPATSGSLSEDNLSDRSRIILFVLEKFDVSQSDTAELAHWDKMGTITKKVRMALLQLQSENHELLSELTEKGMRTEPEYQIYGNKNGYSISFELIDYDW